MSSANLVCAGRLACALDNNEVIVLGHVSAGDPALHSLRRLVGALAA